jgi:hypothetical protein
MDSSVGQERGEKCGRTVTVVARVAVVTADLVKAVMVGSAITWLHDSLTCFCGPKHSWMHAWQLPVLPTLQNVRNHHTSVACGCCMCLLPGCAWACHHPIQQAPLGA